MNKKMIVPKDKPDATNSNAKKNFMKTSIEEFIQNKLFSIERQLGEMRQLLADMNSDTLTTASLQGKLNEANKKIRNLEYENFFLKNHKKPAKTKK